MAREQPGFTTTFVAEEDMTDHQFRAVVPGTNADEVAKPSGAGVDVIGILQNNPAQGEEATVMMAGRSKIEGAGTLNAMEYISTAANGQLQAESLGTGDGNFVFGRVREGVGSAGNIGSAFINTLAIERA